MLGAIEGAVQRISHSEVVALFNSAARSSFGENIKAQTVEKINSPSQRDAYKIGTNSNQYYFVQVLRTNDDAIKLNKSQEYARFLSLHNFRVVCALQDRDLENTVFSNTEGTLRIMIHPFIDGAQVKLTNGLHVNAIAGLFGTAMKHSLDTYKSTNQDDGFYLPTLNNFSVLATTNLGNEINYSAKITIAEQFIYNFFSYFDSDNKLKSPIQVTFAKGNFSHEDIVQSNNKGYFFIVDFKDSCNCSITALFLSFCLKVSGVHSNQFSIVNFQENVKMALAFGASFNVRELNFAFEYVGAKWLADSLESATKIQSTLDTLVTLRTNEFSIKNAMKMHQSVAR